MAKTVKRSRTSKPTKAYLRFEGVVQRSLNLLTLQAATVKIWHLAQPEQVIDLSDMSRASAVLAVAAMDSYFTDVFVERLVHFIKLKGATKQLVALLHEAGIDTECALQLIVMKSPFRKITKMVESHLSLVTTQKTEAIDKLFLVYSIKDFCANVAGFSKKGPPLLASIRMLVSRRHRIVHEGDLNSHGRANKADPKEFQRRIHDLVLFVSKADELLNNQLWK